MGPPSRSSASETPGDLRNRRLAHGGQVAGVGIASQHRVPTIAAGGRQVASVDRAGRRPGAGQIRMRTVDRQAGQRAAVAIELRQFRQRITRTTRPQSGDERQPQWIGAEFGRRAVPCPHPVRVLSGQRVGLCQRQHGPGGMAKRSPADQAPIRVERHAVGLGLHLANSPVGACDERAPRGLHQAWITPWIVGAQVRPGRCHRLL
jgi:hypothetical protein